MSAAPAGRRRFKHATTYPFMKHIPMSLNAALVLAACMPALRAAEEKTAPKEEKRELRVLAAPSAERRVFVQAREGERRPNPEKETVAFLGVETSAVSATLAAQLPIPRGSGLVVNHVVEQSPILIETRQLSVLIRQRKEGHEVTLTLLRAGKETTAKVKLGKHEVPKYAGLFESPATRTFTLPMGGAGGQGIWEMRTPEPGQRTSREEVDRVLSLMHGARGGAPVRVQIDSHGGPGLRAIGINTANSNLVFSDDEGSLELRAQDGVKTLVAKDAGGKEVFAGPVNTPEERKALPAQVRARFEKLEGMQDITFRTDGDFPGGETKVVRPPGRGISLPAAPRSERRPAGFF
jgi:serine protease Do